jgi:hypothetical protein
MVRSLCALLLAVYWQPPGRPAAGDRARAAFADAARDLGATLLDASASAPGAPSLAPALQAAIADYAGFRFAPAIAALDELQRLVDARGGGDLDARQLSEVYLYRGLARLELGPAEAAWDDLVRAARLDPGRPLDPARFPPKVLAAWKRAVAEVAQLPRAELQVIAPAGASVRIDGHPVSGAATVIAGAHFVAVDADGYEPWAQVVPVAGPQRIEPPLRTWQPPDGDRLLALAREKSAEKVLLGALVRHPDGWRFVARAIAAADGKTVSDGVVVGDQPLSTQVLALARRLIPPPLSANAPTKKSRWWIWATVGASVAAALVIAIPIGVVYGSGSNGNVSTANPLK